MAKSEARRQSEILIAATAEPDTFFWRSNTGVAWQGSRVERLPGNKVLIHNAQPIKYNLPGTPDVLGCHIGRATVIECKSGDGVLSEDQKKWRKAWERAGGVYIVGRQADAVVARLREERAKNGKD